MVYINILNSLFYCKPLTQLLGSAGAAVIIVSKASVFMVLVYKIA